MQSWAMRARNPNMNLPATCPQARPANLWIAGAAMLLGLACADAAQTFAAEKPAAAAEGAEGMDASAVVTRMTQKYTGDLGLKTRAIRVLVHYSRTTFYVSSGKPRGYEYDLMREFEAFYNKGRPRREARVPVIFIPVRFEELIPKLLEGQGDVAAGLMTITGARARRVTFTLPYLRNVTEVVVAHAGAPALSGLDDLSGHTIHVLRGSSFVASLKTLNARLSKAEKPPVTIVELPSGASAEDLLEMVNAGIFRYTVADDLVANLWAKALPGLRVLNAGLSEGNSVAWAVRRNNPKLLAALNDFIDEGKDKLPKLSAELHARYFKDVNSLKNNLDPDVVGRKKALVPHFRSAGQRQQFDWMFIMAQGFQESGLNQAARSTAGAVGVMQLLPATARDMGYHDVETSAKSNIEAGAKYLRFIINRYFDEPELPAAVRFDFALAAYNAGPARIQQMRKLAAERGFDANRWFYNVELVTQEKVGAEPVEYVSNIHRYYMAYRLSDRLEAEDDAIRKASKEKTR
jgi:membrane-bound lytic murein transglycosylase MltF